MPLPLWKSGISWATNGRSSASHPEMRHDRLARHLLAFAGEHGASLVEHEIAARHGLGEGHVLLDQDERRAGGLASLDQRDHVLDVFSLHALRGLVQEDERGVLGQRAYE